MKLGIDFGTTRTIVALVDRGNYPVVSFLDAEGEFVDHFPSVAARVDGHLVFGFEALAAAARGVVPVRSFKRHLAAASVHPDTTIEVGGEPVRLLDLVTGFLAALGDALRTASNITDMAGGGEKLQAVVAVPAHAHSAQRLVTLDAFRAAGFRVLGLLNEPSAAGFEFTHRQPRSANRRRTKVVVYDLGGGTFDASLVRIDDLSHEVEDSVGINRLGGDDFDEVLADLAQERAGRGRPLGERERARLLEECRTAKEHLVPQTRRIALDVADTEVVVGVEDFYSRVAPLVESCLAVLEPLLGGLDADQLESAEVAGIYLVGGASGLPLVARVLRERFGRRVHRSPHPAASTAIGLAIAADEASGFQLTDRLSRGFGVFREWDAGASLSFDEILGRDRVVRPEVPLALTRRYRAAHNVGEFRFVEYSQLGPSGQPTGDVVPLEVIRFPFDAALRDGRDLVGVPVRRLGEGPLVEERYALDAHGVVTVELVDLEDGYARTYALGRPIS